MAREPKGKSTKYTGGHACNSQLVITWGQLTVLVKKVGERKDTVQQGNNKV